MFPSFWDYSSFHSTPDDINSRTSDNAIQPSKLPLAMTSNQDLQRWENRVSTMETINLSTFLIRIFPSLSLWIHFITCQ